MKQPRKSANRTDRGAAQDEIGNLTTALARRFEGRLPGIDPDAIQAHLALGRAFHKSIRALEAYVLPDGTGLSRSKCNFLAVLYLAEGNQLVVGAIARELGLSPASATRILDGFEQEGLIERVPSPSDRRITYARLTARGLIECENLLPSFLRFIQHLGDALTDGEKLQLTQLLTKYELGAVRLAGKQADD